MFETNVKILPRGFCIYAKYLGERKRSFNYFPQPRKANVSQGLFSQKSRSRLRTAIDWLIFSSKYKTVYVKKTASLFRYKVNFITLTLPSAQIHSDSLIVKKIFSPFMEAWQKRAKGLLYVYKAEKQDNGNLHFHVIANTFFHYKKLRNKWNKAVEKLGYISRSKVLDPNSTDVHALSNKGDLSLYLTSYFAKKDIYKKPLKRYFKRFRSALADQSRVVCHLPKKYFLNIKPRVSCALWGASKALLNINPTEQDHPQTKEWKTLHYLAKTPMAIRSDFSAFIPTELYAFTVMPRFAQLVNDSIKRVLEIQSFVPQYEEIEEL